MLKVSSSIYVQTADVLCCGTVVSLHRGVSEKEFHSREEAGGQKSISPSELNGACNNVTCNIDI